MLLPCPNVTSPAALSSALSGVLHNQDTDRTSLIPEHCEVLNLPSELESIPETIITTRALESICIEHWLPWGWRLGLHSRILQEGGWRLVVQGLSCVGSSPN